MPARRPSFAFLLAVAGLLASGCSGIRIESDYDPTADFSTFQTYAWHERAPQADTTGVPVRNDLLDQRIMRAVDDNLEAKGLRRVGVDAADILITDYVGVEQKVEVDTYNSGYGYGGWYGSRYGSGVGYRDTRVYQYDEGTLVLDMIDPESMQLIWRGIARKRLREQSTPEQREKAVREAVDAILAKFPPGT